MWWGYSPALDLLAEYESHKHEEKGKKEQRQEQEQQKQQQQQQPQQQRQQQQHAQSAAEDTAESGAEGGAGADAGSPGTVVNVLLLGCADGRHCLQTLARRYRQPPPLRHARLNFFVAEPTLELVARQLLLQSVVLAAPDELGPREKARLFLELYGNSLLRRSSAAFLRRRGRQLANLVSDEQQLRETLSASLDALKHRERDYLQDVFLLWGQPPPDLSMTALWERRLRAALGVRFDSRSGIFDWDYHMRLRELGGDGVSPYEYKHWRETGVAFTWLETECGRPNPTLLSWVARAHGQLVHSGYLGDIESGPYPAFGVDSEDADMLRSCNGVRVKRSTDVSERNLLRIAHELEHSEPYEPPREEGDSENVGVVITEIPDARDDWEATPAADAADAAPAGCGGRSRDRDAAPPPMLPLGRTLIRFLPPSAIVKYSNKPRYRGMFDVVVLSQSLAHILSPELVAMAKDGALLLVEGRKFAVGVRKNDVQKFGEMVQQKAKEASCVPTRSFDSLKDTFARFRVQRQES